MTDFTIAAGVPEVVSGSDDYANIAWPETRAERYANLLRQVDILETAGQVADERTQQELDNLFAAMTDHERLRAMAKYLRKNPVDLT